MVWGQRLQAVRYHSHARTGSNFLRAGLNTSPQVWTGGEILAQDNREHGEDFAGVLARHFRPQENRRASKLFYYHLTASKWQQFAELELYRITHLVRPNRLRTLVSLAIAEQTGIWFKHTSATVDARKITLDCNSLVQKLSQIESEEQRIRQQFNPGMWLEYSYEDLVTRTGETLEEIEKFLGVDGIDHHKIRLRKQNPEPLNELIENWAEVRRSLENTPYERYLD